MNCRSVAAAIFVVALSACYGMPSAGQPPQPSPPPASTPVDSSKRAEDAETEEYTRRLDAADADAKRALEGAGPNATPQLRALVERVDRFVSEGRRRLKPKKPGSMAYSNDIWSMKKMTTEDVIGAAEKAAADAARVSEEILAAAAKKQAAQGVANAFEETKTACKNDVPACEKACTADPASDQCVALALATAAGKAGTKADFVRAHALVKKGCELGNKLACTSAKSMHNLADKCDDLELCSHLCDAGLGGGCANAGELLRDAKKKDLAKAAGFFKRGCDLGDPASCNDLGAAYLLGEGVTRDTKVAESYFTKACDGFQVKVNANPKEEALWLARRDTACQNAYGTACVNKVQIPAKRRPDVDAICKKKALPPIAWSTSDGTDSDAACMNAMMNRGCQQVMGTKAYCCPAQ